MRVCICVYVSVGAKERNQSSVRVGESACKHVCFVIDFEKVAVRQGSVTTWGKRRKPTTPTWDWPESSAQSSPPEGAELFSANHEEAPAAPPPRERPVSGQLAPAPHKVLARSPRPRKNTRDLDLAGRRPFCASRSLRRGPAPSEYSPVSGPPLLRGSRPRPPTGDGPGSQTSASRGRP